MVYSFTQVVPLQLSSYKPVSLNTSVKNMIIKTPITEIQKVPPKNRRDFA
jgi:hypothetical protein